MSKPNAFELLASDTKLAILAKYVADGTMIGAHKGTRRGTGSEFSQYRSYQPGDDIRQVDWKMFARSDRYYIKESETETSVTIRFFLDASASMMYRENDFTRFRYASVVTAALAEIAYRQGDAIALHLVNNQSRTDLREKRGKPHLNRFIQLLENADCTGSWPAGADWLPDCMSSHHRELWVVCSDFLDGTAAWKSFVEMSGIFGHEVHFLQILGEQELNLSFKGTATFRDPESNRQMNIRTKSVRDRYIKNLNNYQKKLKETLAGRKNRHDLITMDTPPDESLRNVLTQRKRS